MTLKESILEHKRLYPNDGYKKIAKILNCNDSTVRYHLNLEYQKNQDARVISRRKNNKRILVEENGGQCSKCGYNKCIAALEFHHLNSNLKEKNQFSSMTLDKAREEIKKCILVCSNCHREIHATVA